MKKILPLAAVILASCQSPPSLERMMNDGVSYALGSGGVQVLGGVQTAAQLDLYLNSSSTDTLLLLGKPELASSSLFGHESSTWVPYMGIRQRISSESIFSLNVGLPYNTEQITSNLSWISPFTDEEGEIQRETWTGTGQRIAVALEHLFSQENRSHDIYLVYERLQPLLAEPIEQVSLYWNMQF